MEVIIENLTIALYWKENGIDIDTLEAVIDYFPEDSDASNCAKELIGILIDEAFE